MSRPAKKREKSFFFFLLLSHLCRRRRGTSRRRRCQKKRGGKKKKEARGICDQSPVTNSSPSPPEMWEESERLRDWRKRSALLPPVSVGRSTRDGLLIDSCGRVRAKINLKNKNQKNFPFFQFFKKIKPQRHFYQKVFLIHQSVFRCCCCPSSSKEVPSSILGGIFFIYCAAAHATSPTAEFRKAKKRKKVTTNNTSTTDIAAASLFCNS